jgi:hypothetical protein
MIESIYDAQHMLTAGSDIAVINLGRMTRRKAREIIAAPPATAAHDRIRTSLARDFPGVRVKGLSKHAGVYAPLMGEGGNAIYHTLSLLYKTAMGVEATSTMSRASVIDFALLCWHLNGQYFLTANSVSVLWSEALHLNSVETLVYDSSLLENVAFLTKLFQTQASPSTDNDSPYPLVSCSLTDFV